MEKKGWRIGFAMLALVSGGWATGGEPAQKGWMSGHPVVCGHPHCRSHHCKSHKHHHCEAPYAPILGSAPAMLAPVILTRHDAQAFPKPEDQTQEELEKLRRLLELLDEIAPELQRPAPSAPSESPQSQLKALLSEFEQAVTSQVSEQLKAFERQQALQIQQFEAAAREAKNADRIVQTQQEKLFESVSDSMKLTGDGLRALKEQIDKLDGRLKEVEKKP